VLFRDETKNENEWKRLYDEAEKYIKTGKHQFDHSIRHNLVLEKLSESYGKERAFEQIPLAAERRNQHFVEWSSAHTVFDLENRPNNVHPKHRFNLFPGVICERVIRSKTLQSQIANIQIHDVVGEGRYWIQADVFILCTGAVHNPQVCHLIIQFFNLGSVVSLDCLDPCQLWFWAIRSTGFQDPAGVFAIPGKLHHRADTCLLPDCS
jgi:pyranose oxidase